MICEMSISTFCLHAGHVVKGGYELWIYGCTHLHEKVRRDCDSKIREKR